MNMPSSRAIARSALGIVRRRPFSSVAATSTVTAVGYANYVEFRTKQQLKSIETIIPRDHYDGDFIARYWEHRPVTIAKRLLSICNELLPVAGEYVYSFHLRPWAVEKINADSKGSRQLEVDLEHKRQMERDLSRKLRNALTQLGPTFIKVGQQLSIRPDLISPTVLFELQRLCDAVPPFDDKIAMRVLAQELSANNRDDDHNTDWNEDDVNRIVMSVFQEMPNLVASASLGQVYKATT